MSLSKPSLPNAWKKANIVLIPKMGDGSDPNNYRSISLLPLPGKMLKKIVQTKLLDFWTSENLITPRQGGFGPKHATTSTLLTVPTDILQTLNNSGMVGGI